MPATWCSPPFDAMCAQGLSFGLPQLVCHCPNLAPPGGGFLAFVVGIRKTLIHRRRGRAGGHGKPPAVVNIRCPIRRLGKLSLCANQPLFPRVRIYRPAPNHQHPNGWPRVKIGINGGRTAHCGQPVDFPLGLPGKPRNCTFRSAGRDFSFAQFGKMCA